MKVLGIGKSVIDEYHVVETITGESLENDRHSRIQHIGGPVVTSMILLSRLGVDCTYLTGLGRDREGRIIKAALEDEQVRVIENLQHKTKINQIFVEAAGGKRKKENLAADPEEYAPSRFLAGVKDAMKEVMKRKMVLFSNQ